MITKSDELKSDGLKYELRQMTHTEKSRIINSYYKRNAICSDDIYRWLYCRMLTEVGLG